MSRSQLRAREDDDADADRHQAGSPTDVDEAPAIDLDRVGLDERVRQQLAGQPLDDRARRRLVGGLDGQLDAPPDADGADALDAEVARLPSTARPCGSRMPGLGVTLTANR